MLGETVSQQRLDVVVLRLHEARTTGRHAIDFLGDPRLLCLDVEDGVLLTGQHENPPLVVSRKARLLAPELAGVLDSCENIGVGGTEVLQYRLRDEVEATRRQIAPAIKSTCEYPDPVTG